MVVLQCSKSVLQIRRGKRDNLGMIFHITPLKHMLRSIIRTVPETVLIRDHNMFIMHPKDADGMAEPRLYDLRLQFCPDVSVAVLRIFMLLLLNTNQSYH